MGNEFIKRSVFGHSASEEVLKNRIEARRRITNIDNYSCKFEPSEIKPIDLVPYIDMEIIDPKHSTPLKFYSLSNGKEKIISEFKDYELLVFLGNDKYLSPSQIGIGVKSVDGVDYYNNQWVHDDENLDLKIIVEKEGFGLNILVSTIEWPHPHEPVENWKIAKTISKNITIRKLQKLIISTLTNDKFFINCGECGRWSKASYSFDDATCCSCAEKIHNIVY